MSCTSQGRAFLALLGNATTSVLVGNGPNASHAKLMVVDGQVAVVGSANGDKQS